MTLLSIDWGSVGIKTLQFILSFSILVTLHELGHFLTARWFKCRVEKFYLFFNPWFSLWKKKIGETEYGIGWVPFGGYVKISGMVDESMDKEQMKQPPQPWEFRSKPAWQRLIIMIGGVVVNVLLAIVIFICITWVWGEEYLPAKNLTYGIYADSLGKKIGLQDGDMIVSLDGKPVQNISTLPADIMLSEAKTMQVQRNGAPVDIAIPEGFIGELNKNKLDGFVGIRFPVVVDSVAASAVVTSGELKKGDRLISINNQSFNYFNEFNRLKTGLQNKEVPIQVVRGADTVGIRMKVNEKGSLGFFFQSPAAYFQTVQHKYTLSESFPVGFRKCFETLDKYITGIGQIFSGKVSANDSLGSVISIGNTFPGFFDWQRFWTLTAIFSIILAFMNILPIPALDGGHALFTLAEMITGRKPSDKFMEYAQMVGMVLLLGLMAYALGLDVMRLFK